MPVGELACEMSDLGLNPMTILNLFPSPVVVR
jgi:hypothetical protein